MGMSCGSSEFCVTFVSKIRYMTDQFKGLTLGNARKLIAKRLANLTDSREAEAIARIAVQFITRYDVVGQALHANEPVSDFNAGRLAQITARLLNHEPIQYITGEADWGGLKIEVNPTVLIPRPETAQLVDIITDRWGAKQDLNVMDVCTGSGSIAVALALRLPFSRVRAIDISSEALAVARSNAARYKANIDFLKLDALSLSPQRQEYDIIVSNPPYIPMSERPGIEPHVRDHEPEIALFVPDNDPLRFYKAIVQFAASALKPDGAAYFEIHPNYASRLIELASLAMSGRNVVVERDMFGLNRFLIISQQ